jgi:hypothetical protein
MKLRGLPCALALVALALGCARRGGREYGYYDMPAPDPQTPLPAAAYGWFGPPHGAAMQTAVEESAHAAPSLPGEPMPVIAPMPTDIPEPTPTVEPTSSPAAVTVATYSEALPVYTASAPALRMANMTPGACLKEVRERKLPFTPSRERFASVAGALRVDGPIEGVTFVTARPPHEFGVLDCRLALAMVELAKIAAPFGVTQIHVGSMFRKNARIAHRPKTPSQHSFGLAMDIVSMRLADGRLLSPERDWHAQIGDKTCGAEAVMTDPDDKATILRNFVCAVARSQIFHHMLTPSANRAHHDHLHFDLKRGTKYQSYQ